MRDRTEGGPGPLPRITARTARDRRQAFVDQLGQAAELAPGACVCGWRPLLVQDGAAVCPRCGLVQEQLAFDDGSA